MALKYNIYQKMMGWPNAFFRCSILIGSTQTIELFARADYLFKEKQKEYKKKTNRISRQHVFCALALETLYMTLKRYLKEDKAYSIVFDGLKPRSEKKGRKLCEYSREEFFKKAHLVSKVKYSSKSGFKRKWIKDDKDIMSYEITVCPYVNILNELGCIEICKALCSQDDITYMRLKDLEFKRTKMISKGDECCDFKFVSLGYVEEQIVDKVEELNDVEEDENTEEESLIEASENEE